MKVESYDYLCLAISLIEEAAYHNSQLSTINSQFIYMALSNIEKHYNKHPEDLRLQRRHGIVEFETTMHHLRRFIHPDTLKIGRASCRERV